MPRREPLPQAPQCLANQLRSTGAVVQREPRSGVEPGGLEGCGDPPCRSISDRSGMQSSGRPDCPHPNCVLNTASSAAQTVKSSNWEQIRSEFAAHHGTVGHCTERSRATRHLGLAPATPSCREWRHIWRHAYGRGLEQKALTFASPQSSLLSLWLL